MKNKLPPRQTAILVGTDDWLVEQVCAYSTEPKNAVYLDQQNFTKAKNLLGQEFDFIVYDGRQALNLEALAIAGGTLKAGGVLLLLFNHWQDLGCQTDQDSLRWSGEKQAISTPYFMAFFQQQVRQHQIPIYQQSERADLPLKIITSNPPEPVINHSSESATPQQQAVLDEILKQQKDIYIVTAKRGRGKSALAGLLAKALSGEQKLILTAPNKSAVKILQDFADNRIDFIPPDQLYSEIKQQPEKFRDYWLLIDEAAMIPLELLNCLTSAFKHILCTTTIHSYEGTGRGFLLKFVANLQRPFQQFELYAPLRWAEDDVLEKWIEEILLLEAEDKLRLSVYRPNGEIKITQVSRTQLIESAYLEPFYGLLTAAHYRTSPLDLRRLFDVKGQHFWLAECATDLVGCVWALQEGDLQDRALIEDICRGSRRPPGNLVVQTLAFQLNLGQACELTSLRISRIAVQPDWQQQGIGQELISVMVRHCEVDFLSVSFGYTPQLMKFWQQCGFVLVHLGEHKEASSGCYSAIALYPLSKAGRALTESAAHLFRRNIGLSFHPLAKQFEFAEDWQLTKDDWLSLQNFANFNRTLSAGLPAIRRLLAVIPATEVPLLAVYCRERRIAFDYPLGKKAWLKDCRLEVKNMLQKYETLLS